MANPYSKYSGARVQPLPSGYLEAYGNVGRSLGAGIAGAGKSLAEGIQRYYQNKEERAIATGEAEALFAVVEKHGVLYPDFINDEMQKKLETMDDMSKPQLLKFVNSLKQKKSGYDNARKAEQEKALMQLQRDKLEAEKKKNLADAEAARLKAAEDARKRTDEQKNLLAIQTAYGAIQKTDHLGHYLPDRNVSVPLDSPAAQPSMLRPFEAPAELISDTYYPGVREGKLPDEAAAKALAGAGTFAGAKDIVESLEEDETTAPVREKVLNGYRSDKAKKEADLGRPLTPQEDDSLRSDWGIPTSASKEQERTGAEQAAANLASSKEDQERKRELHPHELALASAQAKLKAAELAKLPAVQAHNAKMREFDATYAELKNKLAQQDVKTDEQLAIEAEADATNLAAARLRVTLLQQAIKSPKRLDDEDALVSKELEIAEEKLKAMQAGDFKPSAEQLTVKDKDGKETTLPFYFIRTGKNGGTVVSLPSMAEDGYKLEQNSRQIIESMGRMIKDYQEDLDGSYDEVTKKTQLESDPNWYKRMPDVWKQNMDLRARVIMEWQSKLEERGMLPGKKIQYPSLLDGKLIQPTQPQSKPPTGPNADDSSPDPNKENEEKLRRNVPDLGGGN